MTCKIGIIGNGFVGGATRLLENSYIEVLTYDIDPKKCVPTGLTFQELCNTEAIFISVPTPIILSDSEYGKCNTKIVDSIVRKLLDLNYNGYIIIRSTVPVGYCQTYNSKKIHFMPEFLTEKNWKEDFLNCKLWIFGISNFCKNENEIKEVKEWFNNFLNKSPVRNKNCIFVNTNEAEYVKYFRNCFLAVKVSFCNEMYQFAKANEIDYDTIRKIACDDDRIGQSHTLVPGHDGHFGFGLSCLSKDPASVEYQMKKLNIRSDIISAALKRNNEVDRPEKDWMKYSSE